MWLKFAQRFWRWRFLNFVNVFSLFRWIRISQLTKTKHPYNLVTSLYKLEKIIHRNSSLSLSLSLSLVYFVFGFRWSISVGWRPSSCDMRRALTSSPELLGQSLPNLVCCFCRARRQEIINFMTPYPQRWRGDLGVNVYKIDAFLLPGHWSDKLSK